MEFEHLTPPETGVAITMSEKGLTVPDRPILPFIQGDGTGPDIWRAAVRVFDAAVERAYGSVRKIVWFKVFAGQESFDVEREKREPTWGDPGWRAIPRDVSQDRIDAAHLHINTDHVKRDVGVALGLRALAALEAEGVIGRLATENYSVMGYQEAGCRVWQTKTGPEIASRLRDAAVHALVLAPA